MIREISFGVEFLKKLLDSKLSIAQIDGFSSALSSILQTRFAGHWKIGQPSHGNAFRSIHTTAEKIDPVIREACLQAEIPPEKIMASLPCCLTLWIDPLEVSYRIGSHGSICHTQIAPPDREDPPATIACATPPPSPARPQTPRSPLLPLPLSRRTSEATLQAPLSPMRRTQSQDLLFSPPAQRRLSVDISARPHNVSRSPSRASLLSKPHMDMNGNSLNPHPPPSPIRRGGSIALDMTQLQNSMVMSY